MNDQFMKASTSHNSDEWETPIDLFSQLNAEFHFNLDAAANKQNHLCAAYFTKEEDGLKKAGTG